MESRSDQQLVQMVLDGDTEAFGFLVERYEKQVYSLAYRLTNDPQEAQDLGQEALIKIYQSLNKYDPGRPFFSWMYKVAANQCYTILRKRREEHTSLDDVIAFLPLADRDDHTPEAFAESRESQEAVRAALVVLPEKFRIPLVLRYMEDMSYKEIAETMGLSLSAVESRIHRGKKLMMKQFDGK